MKNRIIAFLLTVFMAFGLASCKKDKDKKPESSAITVDEEKIEYDSQYVDQASEEVKSLASDFARILGYSDQINTDEMEMIGSTFRNDIVPILADVEIYPSEFTSLMECAHEIVALLDDESSQYGEGPEAVSAMYGKLAAVLDTDRLGALVFELYTLALDSEIDKAQANYDKYGYPYLIEDINYYTELIGRAEALGRKNFADALSVVSFSASLINGSLSTENDGISISAADSFDVLKKQGEKFASLTLSASEWQTVAEMCEVFMPKTGSSFEAALNNDDFFIESADIMPDFLAFYAKLTSDISPDSASSIDSGAQYAVELAICRELVKHEEEFRAFLAEAEKKIPEAGESSMTFIRLNDKAAYEEFCSTYAADSDELISAVKSFLSNPTGANYSLLKDACRGYFAELNSAVAYEYL